MSNSDFVRHDFESETLCQMGILIKQCFEQTTFFLMLYAILQSDT